MEPFAYGDDISYGRVTVIAKTPLTLTPIYRRVHQNYLCYEGLLESFKASIAEFEKAGFIVDYFFEDARRKLPARP